MIHTPLSVLDLPRNIHHFQHWLPAIFQKWCFFGFLLRGDYSSAFFLKQILEGTRCIFLIVICSHTLPNSSQSFSIQCSLYLFLKLDLAGVMNVSVLCSLVCINILSDWLGFQCLDGRTSHLKKKKNCPFAHGDP